MVAKELLDILVCPSCRGELEYDEKADTLTCNNRVHCGKCGHVTDENGKCTNTDCGTVGTQFVSLRYKVKDDIPIMLIITNRYYGNQ
jgi:uncharacterized protein YbaR (Trm112 family)